MHFEIYNMIIVISYTRIFSHRIHFKGIMSLSLVVFFALKGNIYLQNEYNMCIFVGFFLCVQLISQHY